MKTFASNPFDWFNFVAQKYNSTALIQFIVQTEQGIDYNLLKRALQSCLVVDPVLYCVFQSNGNEPLWVETDCALDELCKHIVTEHTQDAIDTFLAENLDVSKACPIKIAFIEGLTANYIVVKIHHALCDAAGALHFVKLLCRMYSALESNHDFMPIAKTPQRGTEGFYKHFDITDKVAAFKPELLPELSSTWGTPHGDMDAEQTFAYRTFRFSEAELTQIKAFAKTHQSSLNATLTAAYFHSLNQLIQPAEAEKEIQFSVNLRPYCAWENSICNLSNMFNVKLPTQSSFIELVKQSKISLDKMITPDILLQSVLACELMSTQFQDLDSSYGQDWKNVQSTGLCSPMISNIGILDNPSLHFGKRQILDLQIVSPAFVGPSFMLAVSSFRGKMTLCVSYQKPSTSDTFVQALLDGMKQVLMKPFQ